MITWGKNITYLSSVVYQFPTNTQMIKDKYTENKFVTKAEYDRLIRKLKLNQIFKNEI